MNGTPLAESCNGFKCLAVVIVACLLAGDCREPTSAFLKCIFCAAVAVSGCFQRVSVRVLPHLRGLASPSQPTMTLCRCAAAACRCCSWRWRSCPCRGRPTRLPRGACGPWTSSSSSSRPTRRYRSYLYHNSILSFVKHGMSSIWLCCFGNCSTKEWLLALDCLQPHLQHLLLETSCICCYQLRHSLALRPKNEYCRTLKSLVGVGRAAEAE